jgi:hypothetical protein
MGMTSLATFIAGRYEFRVTLPTRERDRGLGVAPVAELARLAVAAKARAGQADADVKTIAGVVHAFAEANRTRSRQREQRRMVRRISARTVQCRHPWPWTRATLFTPRADPSHSGPAATTTTIASPPTILPPSSMAMPHLDGLAPQVLRARLFALSSRARYPPARAGQQRARPRPKSHTPWSRSPGRWRRW